MFDERNAQCLVVLASPVADIRKRWKQALGEICILHEASDLHSLRTSLASLKPSVLLLHDDLQGLVPSTHLNELMKLSSATKIMLSSATTDEREMMTGLKAGARGWIHPEIDPVLLRKSIEAVRKGEIWATRSIVPALLQELAQTQRNPDIDRRSAVPRKRSYSGPVAREFSGVSGPYLDRLTSREQEIARLVASGGSNKEIASRLHITESTVKAHLTAIFRKVGVPDRLGLALFIAQQSQLQQ